MVNDSNIFRSLGLRANRGALRAAVAAERPVLDKQDENRITSTLNPSHGSSHLIKAQATIYPDFVVVYVPNQPILSSPAGLKNGLSSSSRFDRTEYETNQERSIRRTRKSIKDYVHCNDFDLFSTFTFSSDRQNVGHSKSKMANWLKNQRSRNGKFKYLIVSEFHKDGVSLHFHALLGGYSGRLVEATNPHTGKLIIENGKQVFNFAEYKSGFSTALKISSNYESRTRVAYYLQKYITKEMPMIFGKNRYWVSQGLAKPIIIEIKDPWHEYITPRHIQNHDFGKHLYYEKRQVEVFLP